MLTATLTSNAQRVDGISYELYRTGDGDNAVADSAIVIGPYSFAGALDIPSSITVPYTYTKFVGYDENDKPKYITVTRDLTYPVTAIEDGAFYALGYESHITSVTIPNTVTRIGGMAFIGCTNISGTITIPSSVNDIGTDAFAFCERISKAIINNSFIGEKEFIDCTGLTNVIMNNSITSIGYCAFYRCTGLTQLVLPNSLRKISGSAFSGCTGLTGHLYIPNSVTTIGESAFSNCVGLTGVTLSNSLTSIGDGVFEYCTGIAQLDIPNSVISIGNRSFYGCTGLTGSLIIPNSVTTIGGRAFRSCTGLTDVILGNSLTTIGDSAFYNCHKLKSLNIPENVNKIGIAAFEATQISTLVYNAKRCTSSSYISKPVIENLTIGNKVEYLPRQFMFNSKITEVTIPESVDTIGEGAFLHCRSLKTVNWNARNCVTKYRIIDVDEDGVDDADWESRFIRAPFINCTNLSHIVIGKDVESIDDKTFYIPSPTPLDTVTCRSVIPSAITATCFNTDSIDHYLHSNVYEKTVLCVPKGSLQAYREAEGWKEFYHIVEMDESMLGDVDGDGVVNIGDVVAIIDYILFSSNNGVNLDNADCDQDGIINIGDVVAIIDYLITNHW